MLLRAQRPRAGQRSVRKRMDCLLSGKSDVLMGLRGLAARLSREYCGWNHKNTGGGNDAGRGVGWSDPTHIGLD